MRGHPPDGVQCGPTRGVCKGLYVKKSRATVQDLSRSSSPLARVAILRQKSLHNEQAMSEALAACRDGLLVLDCDGRITHANEAAARMLGTGQPLEGSAFTDALSRIVEVEGAASPSPSHSPDQGPSLLQRIQSAEEVGRETITLERADGQRRQLGIDASPVLDDRDLMSGMVIHLVDLDQVQEEDAVVPPLRDTAFSSHEDAAALPDAVAKDPLREMAGRIGNDFNNILTSILGNISLARTEVNHDDEVYKTLTYVEKAAVRARELAQRLLLLANPEGATPHLEADLPVETIRGTGRILVMDDEEMVRHVAARTLTYLGYEVDVTSHGEQALAHYAEALAASRPYRAVLMDLTIPDGMGARETIAHLLKIDPSARAIVSTGYSNDPILADYQRLGFRGAIMKPFDILQLGTAVHQVLEASN